MNTIWDGVSDKIDVFVDNHFCQIGINLLNPKF